MRKYFSLPLLSAALCVLLLAGCGGKGGDAATEDKNSLDKLAEAAENMKTAAEEMTAAAGEEREPLPPVSFKVLLTYLPVQIGDMKQENPRGETTAYDQWKFSTANAEYNGGERSARVEIFDYAHIGMMYAPIRMWLKMNIQRESSDGFERTTEVESFPAYEKYDNGSKQAELTMLVGDRFVVKIDTRGLAEDAPRKVAASMNLKKLAKESAQPPA